MESFGEIKIDKKDVPTIEADKSKSKSPKLPKRTFAMTMLTFIAIIGIGLGSIGLVLCIEKNSEADYLGEQIAEKDAIISELQKTLTECGEGATGISSETMVTPRNSLLHLDEGKCLNCFEAPHVWSVTDRLNFDTPTLLIRTGGVDAAIAFFVSWDALNEYYGYTETTNVAKTGIESNVNIELSGKSVDFLVSGFGNAMGYETALFLMEDGTVEYIPIVKAVQEGRFRSYGKIPGITDIVKLYVVEHGGYSLLAQRADGDYYDLSTILLKTGNYSY